MTEIPTPVEIATPSRRYTPVGRCIYCGAFSNKLTLEHIIPFGLAGNALLLPKASCKTCESITGGFEQSCLRTILGPFRLRVGTPTRNPKERPSELPLTLAKQIAGQRPIELATILVPTQEFPLAFIGLRLRPAGVLSGKDPTGMVDGEGWVRCNEEEMRKYLPKDVDKSAEGYGLRLGRIKPVTFARLLAKIAHSYAIAETGFGSFRPLVTNLILGKTDTLSQWVGGEWDIPPATQAAFELKKYPLSANGKNYLMVNVRLFSFYETPQYHVVVGEI
jgi:hypothetical protein